MCEWVIVGYHWLHKNALYKCSPFTIWRLQEVVQTCQGTMNTSLFTCTYICLGTCWRCRDFPIFIGHGLGHYTPGWKLSPLSAPASLPTFLPHREVFNSRTGDLQTRWIPRSNQGRNALMGQKWTRIIQNRNGLTHRQAQSTRADILQAHFTH